MVPYLKLQVLGRVGNLKHTFLVLIIELNVSSNILLLGDCEKVDCVHILTDSLKCNTVMGSSKNQ